MAVATAKGIAPDEKAHPRWALAQTGRRHNNSFWSAWRLGALRLFQVAEEVNPETFTFRLRKKKLRQVRRREGRYLLHTNLPQEDPAKAWQFCMQLSQVEEAFKNLKGDLVMRPIYHPLH